VEFAARGAASTLKLLFGYAFSNLSDPAAPRNYQTPGKEYWGQVNWISSVEDTFRRGDAQFVARPL